MIVACGAEVRRACRCDAGPGPPEVAPPTCRRGRGGIVLGAHHTGTLRNSTCAWLSFVEPVHQCASPRGWTGLRSSPQLVTNRASFAWQKCRAPGPNPAAVRPSTALVSPLLLRCRLPPSHSPVRTRAPPTQLPTSRHSAIHPTHPTTHPAPPIHSPSILARRASPRTSGSAPCAGCMASCCAPPCRPPRGASRCRPRAPRPSRCGGPRVRPASASARLARAHLQQTCGAADTSQPVRSHARCAASH